ncbi:MAG: hypothetical protein QGH94_02175 [Phycisphaerae bacterium]|nr:hypothetical protein [Phycisphaerae bacterium]
MQVTFDQAWFDSPRGMVVSPASDAIEHHAANIVLFGFVGRGGG